MKPQTIKRVGIEGTQRGYAVTVEFTDGTHTDLACYHDNGTSVSIDKAYAAACATVESVKRGRFVSERALVQGRKFYARAS